MRNLRIKHGGKVFRDPIHRLIRIERDDEFMLDLIDTPEFQRLRRIRQLGVSCLTFHGAEHSRFVHSLGVFNFAQRIIDALKRRYAGSEVESYLVEHQRVVKAAALLHDIGHGPFSHMIERAFGASGRHEKTTVSMIREPSSGVGRVLARHGVNADSVARLIDHTSEHQLLIDIVSSQLDADRMDYLLRDSYCTGVQYGLYDAEWILNAMCVGSDGGSDGANAPPWRLCLDRRRGERAAEQFILARAHMNEQVYFHRVTRGYEAMLLALFGEAASLASADTLPSSTPSTIVEFLRSKGAITPDAFLRLDESQVLVALHEWAAQIDPAFARMSRWSHAFLWRERLFVAATIQRIDPGQFIALGGELEKSGLVRGVDWHYDDASSAVYKGIQYSAAKGKDDEEERLESIFLSSGKPKESASPIELSSDLVKSLDQKRQSLVRIYVDKQSLQSAASIFGKYKIKMDSSGEES